MSAPSASIGSRNRRFTLELPLESPDGFGGVIRTFQPGPRVWGSLRLLTSMERVRADKAEVVATHRVVLPFRDGLPTGGRLALGTRRFRIRSADDPDGRRRSTVCLVEEVSA